MKRRIPLFHRARHAQEGFSLVELMVALTLGLLVVLALVVLLVNVNRNNTEMSRTNSVIENGRFALQLLDSNISHAGFWGGFVPQFDDLALAGAPGDAPASATLTTVPDPCLAYGTWPSTYVPQLIGIPLQVYEVSSTGTAPTIGTCVASTLMPHPKASTHVLLVRHVAPCAASAAATDEECTLEAGGLYFQHGRCSGTAAPYYTFAAAADATLTNFTLTNRDCATVADKFKYVSEIYYVRDYAVTVGDGIPTLMRSKFRLSGGTLKYDTPEALIQGIEGFRVELGIDNVSKSGTVLGVTDFATQISWASTTTKVTPQNRGDGNPDTFLQCTASTPCTPFNLMNVAAVKLYVLVRAETKTPSFSDTRTYVLGSTTLGPFNDAYKRHVYTQTVRLNNVSMRREVP